MPCFHWLPYFEEVFSQQWCQLIVSLAVQITCAFKATHTSNNLSGDGDWQSGVQEFHSGVTSNNSCIAGLLVNLDGDRHCQSGTPHRMLAVGVKANGRRLLVLDSFFSLTSLFWRGIFPAGMPINSNFGRTIHTCVQWNSYLKRLDWWQWLASLGLEVWLWRHFQQRLHRRPPHQPGWWQTPLNRQASPHARCGCVGKWQTIVDLESKY